MLLYMVKVQILSFANSSFKLNILKEPCSFMLHSSAHTWIIGVSVWNKTHNVQILLLQWIQFRWLNVILNYWDGLFLVLHCKKLVSLHSHSFFYVLFLVNHLDRTTIVPTVFITSMDKNTYKVNLRKLKGKPTCCWGPVGVQIQILTLRPHWICPLIAESPDWSGPCWVEEGWAHSGLKTARTASSLMPRPRGTGWVGAAWPVWKCSELWRWCRQRRVMEDRNLTTTYCQIIYEERVRVVPAVEGRYKLLLAGQHKHRRGHKLH